MNRFRTFVLTAVVVATPAVARPVIAPPKVVVERFLADYAAERIAPMADYIAPDAVMRVPFSPTGPATLSAAQATAYLQSVFAQYQSIVLSDVAVTPAADGRTVFVEAQATYTNHAGETHRVGSIWAIEVVRGKIVRSRTYTVPA
ncbi:MAG: nuclear transport factor 2 family protein [Burkholderiaceae bacterium]